MLLRPITLFGIVASMIGGVGIGILAFWAVTGHRETLRDERLLLSVVRRVGDYYVEDVPRSRHIDNAIRGIIDGLDDHSVFLDERELLDMEVETSGRLGGIGIELGMVDGYITVLDALDDTPAARAGIVAGDRIIEVDHQSLRGHTLREAVDDLRGEPGTRVRLRIRRHAAADSLSFDITRDLINIPSVQGRLLDPGYGYIRVSLFNNSTAEELARVLASLVGDGPLDGLVMDLRNNPGGLLTASVAVADAFLTDGLIVYTEGRVPNSEVRYAAAAGDLIDGAPLAVLINGGSASASEIVASALQDHQRAIVLGTRSFGKGSVQSVMYFQKRRAIKLTTARYLTPTGRFIQSGGVVPDVAVAAAEGESREDYDQRLLAAALAGLRR